MVKIRAGWHLSKLWTCRELIKTISHRGKKLLYRVKINFRLCTRSWYESVRLSHGKKKELICTRLDIDFYHSNTLIWLVGIRGKICLAGSRTWEIDFHHLGDWILPQWKLIYNTVTLTFDWLAFGGKTCLAGCLTWEIDFYHLGNWILPQWKLIFNTVTLSFDWLAFAVKLVWRAA